LPVPAEDEAIPPAAESGERALVAGRNSPTPVEPSPESLNRRSSQRVAVTWSVDCETEDTFLYASITNISEMGIFVHTIDPLPVGTQLTLRFAPPVPVGRPHTPGPVGTPHTPGSRESFVLAGVVQWINRVRPHHDNPNPGMGIRFLALGPDDRERIVETIRTIAYLRDDHRSN
jgi:type IV pilus assembly protein PilZ